MTVATGPGLSLRLCVLLALALLLLLDLPSAVHGHGYLMSPRSRNYIAAPSQDGSWSGGGPDDPAVDPNSQSLNRGGLCGISPLNGGTSYTLPKNAVGGPMPLNIQATYNQSAIIDLEVVLTAHHMGHFEFKACPLANHYDVPTQACFDSFPLEFVSDELYGVAKHAAYPGRAYIPPEAQSPQTGGTISGKYYKYKYKLPSDLNGDIVLLQWHYVTGNSCFDIGYGVDYEFDWSTNNLATCTQPLDECGEGAPEQFFNCAEIKILKTDDSADTTSIPASGDPNNLPCTAPIAPSTYAPAPPPVASPVASPFAPTPTAPTGPQQPGWRCGSTWADANSKCGVPCPTGNSTVCPTGELCYADVEVCASPVAEPTPSPPTTVTTPTAQANLNYCGTSWGDANSKCTAPCLGGQNSECLNGELCYSNCNNCVGGRITSAPVSPTPPPTISSPTISPEPTVSTQPTHPTEKASGRMIAYLGNWQPCPTLSQIQQYTHIVIAFAVTYQYNSYKNECRADCSIGAPVPICNNQNNQVLVDQWRAMGKKVIISFGGAGMGGSWASDVNDCWEDCFGKEESVISQLNTIVRAQNFDGIDIDYEYFYDSQAAQKFLEEVTIGLKNTLPEGQNIITHAPMDPDAMQGTVYYNILKRNAAYLDFLMPQYYNGYTRPAIDGLDGSSGLSGSVVALDHYNDLVNDMFNGDATKVVFGFCIDDCSGTGSNAGSSQAASVMSDLNAEYVCNGGAFFWVANDDTGGSWSSVVNAAIGSGECDTGATDAPVSPTTDAPVVAPTAGPTLGSTPGPTPGSTPGPTPGSTAGPTDAPPTAELVATQTPRCGTSELHARETCGTVCVSGADCPANQWCWGTHPTYCDSPGFTPTLWANPSVSTVYHRCGTSEVDARSFCKKPCAWDSQCTVPGELCYAVHQNYCGSETVSRMLRG